MERAWNAIPQNDIRFLFDTMLTRIRACIQARDECPKDLLHSLLKNIKFYNNIL